MSDLEIREFQIRAVNADERTVEGIAVPYDSPADIGGRFIETFARGAVQDSDDALLFWRHQEPIGRIIEARSADDGWHVKAKISATARGDEAYTLARDGVISKFSVGFEPVDDVYDRDSNTVTRTRVKVREVSLVPHPAYEGATVAQVRAAEPITPKEPIMPEQDVLTRADLTEVRTSIEDIERKFESELSKLSPRDEKPVLDTRSAGEVLKAIVSGDEDTVRQYEEVQKRAYTGGTTADSILLPAWVGDLTRIIADSSPLPALFSTGTLPAEGNTIEFGVLESNTVDVAEQAAEGDDLTFGKVALTTGTAPVKTFGGYTQLTRQEVERSSVNILTHSLNALALAAAKRRNTTLRAFLATQVAAQTTAGNTVAVDDATSYVDWVGAIVDAAGKYEDLALPLGALVVDKATFKGLAGLVDSAGRPLVQIAGQGVNTVGTINVPGISGNLAGVTVVVDTKQAAPGAAFINSSAIRVYNSPVVSLTDSNVVNLSNAYSVYFYAALAAEIPGAIVPAVIGA